MNPVPEAATPDSPAARPPKRALSRVVIEGVQPQVDEGRFPIKRTVGEDVDVRADIFADGHDLLSAVLRFRYVGTPAADADWTEVPMTPLGNDRWTGPLPHDRLGQYEYTIQAWIDRFATWRNDLVKKTEAGQDVASELLEGAELVAQAAAPRPGGRRGMAARAGRGAGPQDDQAVPHPGGARRGPGGADGPLRGPELSARPMNASCASWSSRSAPVTAPGTRCSPARAPTSRAATARSGLREAPALRRRHGLRRPLPAADPSRSAAASARDRTTRSTPAPTTPAAPGPSARREGGHKAIHPELGTLDDFDRLVAAAGELGIEIALDIAFQCSPDHPYVREHPEWFRHRPDGTIKYAENPPKKYQDIYPIDFECADWQDLWDELHERLRLLGRTTASSIFRVDNPHTKPFRFWEWVIAEVCGRASRRDLPLRGVHAAQGDAPPGQVRLLAVVHLLHLAEHQAGADRLLHRADADRVVPSTCGRTCSPTRRTSCPSTSSTAGRPRLPGSGWCWPPRSGRPTASTGRRSSIASAGRAARVGGISRLREVPGAPLGPRAARASSATSSPGSTRIRRENPALHHDHSLRFHAIDNDQIALLRQDDARPVEHPPRRRQPRPAPRPVGLGAACRWRAGLWTRTSRIQVHDLIGDARFLWHGEANFVQLDPGVAPPTFCV